MYMYKPAYIYIRANNQIHSTLRTAFIFPYFNQQLVVEIKQISSFVSLNLTCVVSEWAVFWKKICNLWDVKFHI